MKDSQILSGFQDATPSTRAPQTLNVPVPVFNACELGVVLRAIALVQGGLGLALMFGAGSPLVWVGQWGVATAAALPGVLAWLLVACGTKRAMAGLLPAAQMAAGAVLGALAGAYGCAVVWLTGLLVAPPWWASACSGAAFAALLVGDWHLRYRGRAPADAAARLRALQSRIRPHFLFNTLNSAIALVRAEPAKAEALLEDLSDLFRHALMDPHAVVSLADEIALARRYLAIEQVRFGARLQVDWQLDPAAEAARLPPLILQPLVENAVRHGIEPSPTGGRVRISTHRRGGMAVVRVTNPVPTGAGVRGTGLALQNVRDRLALLHDVKGRFRYGEKDGEYRVSLEVPL